MARIYNKNIQENALKFLQTHYQKRFEKSPFLVQTNVKTTKGKVVGGLVVFTPPGESTFTAALEARSIGAIHSFFPFATQINWLWKTIFVSLVFFLAVAYIGFNYPQYFMHVLVPSVGMLIVYFIAGFLNGEHHNLNEGELANQISRIPANEKWLVLSVDTNLMDLHSQLDILRYKCERKGIGILSVSNGRKVSIVQLPKPKPTIPSDFLNQYQLDIPEAEETVQNNVFKPIPAMAQARFSQSATMIKAG